MITGRWVLKRLIGYEWGIWYDDEESPRESGWCWTRATARRKAGLRLPSDIEERK